MVAYAGSQDATYEAKAQLTLKEGVIRTLSARVAFLQFALDEVQAEKEKLLAEPAAVALRQVRAAVSTEKILLFYHAVAGLKCFSPSFCAEPESITATGGHQKGTC